MRIFTVLVMQKTDPITSTVNTRHRSDIIVFPDETVYREDVLSRMMSRMPDEVKDGVILFFSAEKELITE
jgi:hypothetical protein